tara:strand:- start:77 stop:406 length:330 start_codon:yes stop_codon:yes gene_type:complete
MKTFVVNGIKCLVGQNKNDNWNLLDTIENKNFYFFHLSSFPSPYLFAEVDLLQNNELIKDIAKICLNQTKYKNLKNVKVDYCRVSNLEKGEKVGEVFYVSNRKVKQIKL